MNEITVPRNTRHWLNARLMLAHRQRRWPNINPALVNVWCMLDLGKHITYDINTILFQYWTSLEPHSRASYDIS